MTAADQGVPRTRFIDQNTGDISQPWRYFLLSMWARYSGASNVLEWNIAPPASYITQAADDVSPPSVSLQTAYEDVSPPTTPSTTTDDVSPNDARISALEAIAQMLIQEIENLKQGITA